MGFSLVMLEFSSYDVLRVAETADVLLMGSQILFGLACILCCLVWLSNPGVIERDTSLSFVKLLDTMEASSLCPDCKIVRTPRCRHCTLCNHCVDRYDHHCPWVNNCIGKGNFTRFYCFVFTQSLYLISVAVISIYCKFLFIYLFLPISRFWIFLIFSMSLTFLSLNAFRFQTGVFRWHLCVAWGSWKATLGSMSQSIRYDHVCHYSNFLSFSHVSIVLSLRAKCANSMKSRNNLFFQSIFISICLLV